MKKLLRFTGITLLLLAITGFVWWKVADYQVYEDRPQKPLSEYADLETDFQKLFQLAKDGETIELPAGYFKFSKSLILDGRKNVTIKRAGMDKTVLSFRGQAEGAEGIRVANGSNITLEGFTIQDAVGDNIKTYYVDTITFRNIKTEWTDVPNDQLGAYGIYPVICKNVLIENCEAARASDSGIYIGQSENIVIRNNTVYENVCGINIENCGNVEVHNNETFHNSNGVTVLDIPGLTRYAENIRVHHNKIYDNSLYNFAPAGNVAASNPPGIGIMIWAGKDVQIYENEILNNPFPAMMLSFLSTYKVTKDKPYVPIAASEAARMKVSIAEETSLREDAINQKFKEDKKYSPYTKDISFRNNTWSFGSMRKKLQSKDGRLVSLALGGKDIHIGFDGVENPDGSTFCIDEKSPLVISNLYMLDDNKRPIIMEQDLNCTAMDGQLSTN